MPGKSVTVYDVALVAGVPVERVRLYFQRPWRLPVRQRRLIADAVQGLEYFHVEESGTEPRRKRVAVISPYISVYSFVERIKGITQALPYDEYDVGIFGIEDASQLDRYLRAQTRPGMADGVVLISLPLSEEISRMYSDSAVPLVSIERAVPGFPSVTVDNMEGGRLAARYLLNKGYTKPAFMGDTGMPLYAFSATAMRFQGFRDELNEAGVGLPESRIAWHPQGVDSVPDAFVGLMRQNEPPDALFCASDAEAVVATRTSWQMDIPIPSQLAVLGFDNLDIAEFTGLSSVDQCLLQSGQDAAEMLKIMMSGRRLKSINKSYSLKVAERTST